MSRLLSGTAPHKLWGLRNCSVTKKVFSQQKANLTEALREKVSL